MECRPTPLPADTAQSRKPFCLPASRILIVNILLKGSTVACAIIVGVVLALMIYVYSQLPSYPYGPSHCCLKALGIALLQYAEEHSGRYPTGERSPEASLSLLYREHCGVDAETLRGKTVPVEMVRSILDRGELLGPDSCGWHYVEGLTTSDNSDLALVWDKVGLGHNGEDLHGGHSVWSLGCTETVIPASEWPGFLKQQQELMASRTQNNGQPQSPPAADQLR